MKRSWKKITYIVLAVFVLQAVGIALLFTYKDNNSVIQTLQQKLGMAKQPEKAEESLKPVNENQIAVSSETADEAVKLQKPGKEEVDISKIDVSKEAEELIRNLDVNNAEKNITKYKKAIAEFDIPEGYQKEILKYMKNEQTVSDILIAYNFLNDEYGMIDELEKLLNKKAEGKYWHEIFDEYSKENKEFIPGSFESGYLDNLLKTPGITIDDIMIADRLSQKGLKKFEDLIEMRKEGSTWKNIKGGLNIINVEEKLPRVTITQEQVQKYVESSGMSEQQVKEALVMAAKMNSQIETEVPNTEKNGKNAAFSVDTESKAKEEGIINKVKAGKKKEDIYAEIYSKKYE